VKYEVQFSRKVVETAVIKIEAQSQAEAEELAEKWLEEHDPDPESEYGQFGEWEVADVSPAEPVPGDPATPAIPEGEG
jgi:hypothetical protein